MRSAGTRRGWHRGPRIGPPAAGGALILGAVLILALLTDEKGPTGAEDADAPRTVRQAAVERTVDGDTIVAEVEGRQERVRYIGVDTPETVKPGNPVECYGPQAHALNKRLLEGRNIRLRFDTERRDRFGRLLAYVYTGDVMVNAELVRHGAARTLTIPPNDAEAARLDRLEARARARERGLWGRCER